MVNQLTHFRTFAALFRHEALTTLLLGSAILFETSRKTDAYNILWALVFGFATLNILSLVVKRFDPHPNRMSFGEVLAVGTVIVAIILLGWEMLYIFKVFPIRLNR